MLQCQTEIKENCMEITEKLSEKLSEKELVEEWLLFDACGPLYVCPYNRKKGNCSHKCYKFFTLWERLRFIINLGACPCKVLDEEVVRSRTWEWINSPD